MAHSSYQSSPRVVKTTPIEEDYEISASILGSGFNGDVLEVRDRATDEIRALKVLAFSDKACREVFMHWKASSCRNIVQVLDVYDNEREGQRRLLVIMEHMSGGELFQRIQDRNGQQFTEKQVAELMYHICVAVRHLHAMDIAHRDIKPENLLFASTEEDAILKLTDFGFAKECPSSISGLSTPCYTPYYVAPEILGPDRYNKSCDIWSVGVVMYILLCGYPPFYSNHDMSVSPGMRYRIRTGQYSFPDPEWTNISTDAKELISGMLKVDTNERLTIVEVMYNPWIMQYMNVPETPLHTEQVLNATRSKWPEVQEEMTRSLATMRVDQVTIKELDNSSNKLLQRRQRR